MFVWLMLCWIAGSVLLLARLFIQMKKAHNFLRTACAASRATQQVCEELAATLELRQSPRVLISTTIDGPCTAGLFHPSLLIPQSWQESLSEQECRAVLMHELSHIAGRDSIWDLLSRIVTAIW